MTKTGYWEITKSIVKEVFADTTARKQSFLITGHSQGGTRAALASMFLEKIMGLRIPTVTFAATGPMCVAQVTSSAELSSTTLTGPM